MWTYLMLFILTLWPPTEKTGLHSMRERTHRLREMSEITADIVSTDATPLEALTLENIVAFESGFNRQAYGPAGELGAFQLMIPPKSTMAQRHEWFHRGAQEALRRLRSQGIEGYCGCSARRPCPDMVEHRTVPAREWLEAHPFPTPATAEVAGNP